MFDFSQTVDRHGTWCTQWDYVADRFGQADLLPFTISDMDFATAPCVISAMQERLHHGVLGYSRWQNPEFTGAVSAWFAQRFHAHPDSKTLVYGPSVIYMVAEMIRQWSQPGEGVVVHTPAYDAFYNTIAHNQRQLIPVALKQSARGWQCDMAELECALARPESKILLLCSPHNPTGKVWTRAELAEMAALCEHHGVKVISDEIHMDMVWSDHPHLPWSEVARGPWALFTSASKSFNIPALTGAYGFIADEASRAGYLSALKGRDGLSSPAVLALVAHIAAYQKGAPWLDELRAYLRANLRYIADTLNDAFPELAWQVPEASYLAWIDLQALGIDSEALQQELISRQKAAIMPGQTYGAAYQHFIRLNAGCPRQKLEQGVARLIAGIHTVRNVK